MSVKNRSTKGQVGTADDLVHDFLQGVEQVFADGWYPARRLLLSRVAGSARTPLASWVPETDVEEDARQITVRFALPGVDKDDIRVQVSEESLSISGGRPEEDAAREGVRREMPRGPFLRRVRLPAEVKPESAKAVYRDGVLCVTLARVRVQAGRDVKIE